jgi:hypothetical protein
MPFRDGTNYHEIATTTTDTFENGLKHLLLDIPHVLRHTQWRPINRFAHELLEALMKEHKAQAWSIGPNPPDIELINAICVLTHEIVRITTVMERAMGAVHRGEEPTP